MAIFVGTVAFAVAIAYLLQIFGGGTPGRTERPVADLRLDSWRPSPEELGKEREHERPLCTGIELGAEEQAVVAALRLYGETLEKVGGNIRDQTVRKQSAAVSSRLARYAHKHGSKHLYGLGLQLRDRFVGDLEKLLVLVRANGERASTFQERHPITPEVVAFRELGGGFLPQALRSGLVTDDGKLVAGGRRLAGIFFLVHWFKWAHDVTDFTFHMPPSQIASFWAWKAEQSRNLPLERRLELVSKTAKLWPDYPADYVRGVLVARSNPPYWKDAAQFWQRWLDSHPEDELARRNLDYARSQLRTAAE